jgi:hypothetical protein
MYTPPFLLSLLLVLLQHSKNAYTGKVHDTVTMARELAICGGRMIKAVFCEKIIQMGAYVIKYVQYTPDTTHSVLTGSQ